MKATKEELKEAWQLVNTISMVLNIQSKSDISGKGMQLLHDLLNEVEIIEKKHELNKSQ
jgi:hypothetical protein